MAVLSASPVHLRTGVRSTDDLSFCRTFVPRNLSSIEPSCERSTVYGGELGFKIDARNSGSDSAVKINGRSPRMVPVEEALKARRSSSEILKINGSANDVLNGSAVNGRVINGKNGSNAALVPQRVRKNEENKKYSASDDLILFPSDEAYSWSKENYSAFQRSVDVWTFVLLLRARVYIDEAKWTYIGGFTEDKQQVFWDYTAEKVLTLEYVPGIKINNLDVLDAGGYDRSQIATRAIESYLIQILKTGFFHADPHPGNLAIDVDGSLIYYDFGMMGEIKSFTRERLLQMFYAVYEKDAKKVIQALTDLGALKPTGDMASVRRSVQFFLDNLLNQKPDQEETLSAIGIGYALNPDFSFAKIAAPYAQELLDTRGSQRSGPYLVEQISRQANDARDMAVSMPYRIQRIDEFIRQLDAGDFKLRVRVLEPEAEAGEVEEDAKLVKPLTSVGSSKLSEE